MQNTALASVVSSMFAHVYVADGGGKSVLMMTAHVSVCERYYAEEAICAVEAENGVEMGWTRNRCAHRETNKDSIRLIVKGFAAVNVSVCVGQELEL